MIYDIFRAEMVDRGMTSDEIDAISDADMQRWWVTRPQRQEIEAEKIAFGIVKAFTGDKS